MTTAAFTPSIPPGQPPAQRASREVRSEQFWPAPIDELLVDVWSSSAGLTDDEAARRLIVDGPTVAFRRGRNGLFRGLAGQFTSPITVLLFVAAAVSIALGERVDGTVILAILIVSGLLGFWQEHRAASAVDQLLALVRTTATVFRSGRSKAIPIEEVVRGDVVSLSAGATIPGDARLLESVLSEILILLVIRTRRAFFRSRIGSALLWASVTVAGGTLVIPYTPLAPLLGFVPLPPILVAGVGGIVALYVLASEATKRALFRKAPL
jgi:magnesium-transporting ATPase (P-type)